MTENKFDTWDQAAQVLKDMPQNHDLNTLEQWAIAYAIRCIERDKQARNSLSRTEQAIRETEQYLTSEFEAYQEPEGMIDPKPSQMLTHLEIESRR